MPINQQQPATGQNTSIWAILAIVFAFVFSPLGIIFGIVALREIKKNPNLKGRGLAIAGIVIGGIFTLVIIAAFLLLIYFGALSPDKQLPKCILTSGISCAAFKVTADDITIEIVNNYDNIDNIIVTASDCGTSSSPSSLANGAQGIYTINCEPKLSGSRYTGQLEISYRVIETQLTRNNFGSIVAKIE